MKRCPTCKRTYADDGFTFCLEDGALLSAPYDQQEEKPVSTIRSSGPPPTVTLPSSGSDSISKTGKDEVKPTPLPPTIASPGARPDPKDAKPLVARQPDSTPRKRSKLTYIGIAFALMLIIGVISLYLISASGCSKLNISINCLPQNNSPTTCWLQASQPEIAAQRISKTTWTVSSGKVILENQYYSHLDLTGLEGRQITVVATAVTEQWFCSKTASTSFYVNSKRP